MSDKTDIIQVSEGVIARVFFEETPIYNRKELIELYKTRLDEDLTETVRTISGIHFFSSIKDQDFNKIESKLLFDYISQNHNKPGTPVKFGDLGLEEST